MNPDLERLQQCLVENAQLRLRVDSLEDYEIEVEELRKTRALEENEQLEILQLELTTSRRKTAEAEATAQEHVRLTNQLQDTVVGVF